MSSIHMFTLNLSLFRSHPGSNYIMLSIQQLVSEIAALMHQIKYQSNYRELLSETLVGLPHISECDKVNQYTYRLLVSLRHRKYVTHI